MAKGKVIGPETLVITNDGLIYTGLANGQIVSVDMNGNVNEIALIGNVSNEMACSNQNSN